MANKDFHEPDTPIHRKM